MRFAVKISSLVLFLLLPAAVAPAQIELPKVLSSHMVLQRDLPVHIWGKATPSEQITVAFRGESRTVVVDPLGRFSAYLKPGVAGGPFALTLSGSAPGEEKKVLDDVLVGDLWIASGQSNMEFRMHQAATAAQDLPRAANSRIRLLIVDKKTSDYPLDDVALENGRGWTASSPESAHDFSAVAWYFAREIEAREHVPVGVIDSTWGGTVVESWTRVAALGEDATLAPVFSQWGRMTERESTALLEDKEQERQRQAAKAAGQPEPQFDWHPQLDSWGPGMLWNAMIAPLTPLAIRGVVWYQGESNSKLERGPFYSRIFSTMITDWRRQWGVGDFPFLFVQISNFKSDDREDWAILREQQLKTLALRSTAMAVTIDIGNPDNVHPTNKLDVGLRLARAARALSYGEPVEYEGPVYRQSTPEPGALRLWFDHAKGLTAKDGELTGFEIAGEDGKFSPAKATIDGETLLVSSPAVSAPTQVRYGWANAVHCNLFNGEGLPASPFRTGK